MKVIDLIELLEDLNPNDEVTAFNGDSMQLESVTGALYGGTDGIVELQTDDNS